MSRAAPIFCLSLAVYGALVPWVWRTWPRSGDEPHYLLAAHSLVYDGDLDLSNNYPNLDYLSFFSGPYLDAHTHLRPDGQAVLTHNLGLTFLVAPAYRVGGLRGVLLFLATLGALLATNVFLLGYHVTRNWAAALLGWAAVSFTPPLFWYVYLIYPEMAAGLCVILALRIWMSADVSEAGGDGGLGGRLAERWALFRIPIGYGLALAALPWLSGRYAPVMLVGAGAALWRAWALGRGTASGASASGDASYGGGGAARGTASGALASGASASGASASGDASYWIVAAVIAAAGLVSYSLFSLWLYGSPSPTASYAGPVAVGVAREFWLQRFARGLLGWLADGQRGLLFTGPTYFAAFAGAAIWLKRRPGQALVALVPFLLALTSTALWGGFWIGWEMSARFLVHALPPLGAAVAVLWAAPRRHLAATVALAAPALGIVVGGVVIEDPLRGLASSPAEVASENLGLRLTRGLPAMGGYMYVLPGKDAAVGGPAQAGEYAWHVSAGQPGIALRQVGAPELPLPSGWYRASVRIGQRGAGPDDPVARIVVLTGEGQPAFEQTLYGRDWPAEGDGSGDRLFAFDFHNPLLDQWSKPISAVISSTGRADLWLAPLEIRPQAGHAFGLPLLWLGALAAGAAWLARRTPALAPRSFRPADGRELPRIGFVRAHSRRLADRLLGCGGLKALPGRLPGALSLIAVVAALAWAVAPHPRTYFAAKMRRTLGTVTPDPAATRGRALAARPEAGDPPGLMAYHAPEFYAPGKYEIRLRLRSGQIADPTAMAADVRIATTDGGPPAGVLPIQAGRIPADGEFHTVTFEIENPREQALMFLLDYAGLSALTADTITVAPVR